MYILLNAVEPVDRLLGIDQQLILSWGVQLINTTILIVALYLILYKPVLKFLQARTERIQGEMADAKILMAEATELKAQYEASIKEIETERSTIITNATKTAKQQEESILLAAKEEAVRIKEAAEKEVVLAKEKATRDMKNQIIDISALIAGKYVEQAIDPAIQAKILDQAIEDLGDSTWLS